MRALVTWFAAMCVLLLGAAPALAQNVLIANIERESGHTPQDFNLYVSRSDCIEGDPFTFPATINFAAGDRIEVWSSQGANCTVYAERHGANATCTQIVGLDIPDVKDQDIIVTADQIANSLPQVEDCFDTTGVSSGLPVSLFFLLVTSGEDVAEGNFFRFDTTVDLVGPDPPSAITAGIGEEKLIASFDIPESDEDRSAFVMFCDPNPTLGAGSGSGGASATGGSGGSVGGAAVGGAGGGAGGLAAGGSGGVGGSGGGAGGTGGAGGAVTNGAGGDGGSSVSSGGSGGGASDCGSDLLIPGDAPSSEALPLRCGKGDAGEVISRPLINGVRYAIAVAAVDDLDNYGPLSELACGTPNPIDDFYKLYKEAGGEAGGGFCSAAGAPGGSDRWAWLFAIAGAVFGFAAAWRRVARRRS